MIMPSVWGGHDNATRVDETGHGIKMHRNDWPGDDLANNIRRLLTDSRMYDKLGATSVQMQSQHGLIQTAEILDALL